MSHVTCLIPGSGNYPDSAGRVVTAG